MRTANSMKNVAVVLIGQVLNILLSFGARIVFVRILNAEYLGVNGLFTDVLSILSLAELGFGSAVIYGLYKPLAVKDEKKIKALMNFYAFSYKVIGFTVLALGLGLLPFLNIIIKDTKLIAEINKCIDNYNSVIVGVSMENEEIRKNIDVVINSNDFSEWEKMIYYQNIKN